MPVDTPRILDLRRRVQADPASIAFAQLGEELRRVGAHDEAVQVCRTGLARHPAYLSARVTLGRALIELDRLDDARTELGIVVASASDNLAAIRGLAEIYHLRGDIIEALAYYRRALELARHDPELEETVERMAKQVAPRAAAEAPPSVEALFDFDRLVQQLGATPPPDVPAEAPAPPVESDPVFELGSVEGDPFSALEAGLRQHQSRPVPRTPDPSDPPPEMAQAAVLGELEHWLQALKTSAR